MIEPERIRPLNDKPEQSGKYVLYWMQQAMRTRYNHALEHAIHRANELDLPTLVCFGLMDDYPEANERHYAFMLQGLRDVEANLKARGIKFVVRHGPPAKAAIHYAKDAAAVVCDRGYLRHQKAWRDEVADAVACAVTEIESDVVVPVEVVSAKHESAARTIRPKIHKHWETFLQPLRETKPTHPSLRLRISGDIDVTEPEKALAKLRLDRSVKQSTFFSGGEDKAAAMLADFIKHKLDGYAEGRNEPSADRHSYMAPYLHFGQISPVEIALAVREARTGDSEDRSAYLEELVVRRELAMNHVFYDERYDTYETVPA